MNILTLNAPSSIQDLGRLGYRSMGVGSSGAMDGWALQAGNALMKNPPNTPALELALGSMTIAITEDVSFCITGALYEAYLDDERLAGYWRINAKKGQTLKLQRPIDGMYSYLCVHGGFAVAPILQSTSTNLSAGFGGIYGRALQAGDSLALNTATHLPSIGVARLTRPETIRIIKSSEYENFTSAAHTALLETAWQLQTSSNRMGYRLAGAATLDLSEPLQMPSHGVDRGMIQVPPQGQPIVLMADAQTTGGYPKIAAVIDADIGLMAQIAFGKSCRFELIDAEQAFLAQQHRQRYIHEIQEYANEH
ncbi:biotin-dependent carboxyltransferase family protein [Psychrobacter aestuarii]|uniref:5-oxoprolinase/urea amidolyase family protein n=1 Tax=Psychrobacter aestuarii TaxID=556327 RepID=A0ABP3FG87_9GAMM|nr:biotin-dependent carboxyltransferase family protein [Psychrobacter aestuarii]